MFRDLETKEKYLLTISVIMFIIFEYINQKIFSGMMRRIIYSSFIATPIFYIFTKDDVLAKFWKSLLIFHVVFIPIFLFPLPKTIEYAKKELENKYPEEMKYDEINTYANEIPKKGFFDINEYDVNYKYSFTGKESNKIYLYNPNTQEIEIKE